ncbi:hypothetical protein BS50DRAFT_567143 [Corynespora cassiicola Philippines]|uniref:AA1-like domain-containing protein n=1 Tax=Corynespora cassiicola Philippines TaxID=1448308 RepID=A0A2T2P9F1_CORCC|nr:hypothetical protein BS50DRAFT_567143 [Corynespora cassiicola Philippines]
MQKLLLVFSLVAAGLAAPTSSIVRRATESITLFDNTDYGGASYTLTFEVPEGIECVSPTLPASIDGLASSVRLSITGSDSGFNCRLFAAQNCDASAGPSTWFFQDDIPNLAAADYNLNNQARSIACSFVPVS